MNMFQVKTDICRNTGISNYEILFDIGTGTKQDKGSFMRKADMDNYILTSKRDFILIMFEKYVNHARILTEVGARAFYRTPEKLTALDRCQNYNHWFQDKQLQDICIVILKIREDLEKILPSPGNNSFESSKGKLLDMIVFCKREVPHSNQPTLASIRKQPIA